MKQPKFTYQSISNCLLFVHHYKNDYPIYGVDRIRNFFMTVMGTKENPTTPMHKHKCLCVLTYILYYFHAFFNTIISIY